MAAQAEIKAVITAKDEASSVLGKFGSGFGNVAGAVTKGAAIAGAAIAAFGVASTMAFSESEDAAMQLNAVLKSTGGVAGVTADKANELASSLQGVTKFSDEAILGGENLLLTFTNIGKDIFPQATEVMLDMSQALGQDVKSSAIQLGKALQDPILGVTALRRVGVNFSEAQQDVIKNLVETGRAGEAQAMILKELQTEFGGSAKAAGSTLSGQLTILKNTFGDVMEIIGGGIASVIKPAITAFNNWYKAVGGGQGIIDSLKNTWSTLVTGKYTGGIFGLNENSDFIRFLKSANEAARNVAVTVQTYLGPIFTLLGNAIGGSLIPALKEMTSSLQPQLTEALKAIAVVIGTQLLSVIAALALAATGLVYIWTGWAKLITAINQPISDMAYGFFGLTNTTEALKQKAFEHTNTVRSLTDAMWAQIQASNVLKGAQLDLQGASLAVEGAQRSYNDAVARYGPTSFEARMAAHNLELAKNAEKDASARAAAATQDYNNKNQDVINKHGAVVGAINNISGAFNSQQWTLQSLNRWGQEYIATLKQIPNTSTMTGSIPDYLRKRATGGPVGAGQPYLIGEKGPELFVPNQNGMVVPNNKLVEASSRPTNISSVSENNSNTTVNINVGMMTGSAVEQREAAMRIFENLQDIANTKGQSVAQLIGSM